MQRDRPARLILFSFRVPAHSADCHLAWKWSAAQALRTYQRGRLDTFRGLPATSARETHGLELRAGLALGGPCAMACYRDETGCSRLDWAVRRRCYHDVTFLQ